MPNQNSQTHTHSHTHNTLLPLGQIAFSVACYFSPKIIFIISLLPTSSVINIYILFSKFVSQSLGFTWNRDYKIRSNYCWRTKRKMHDRKAQVKQNNNITFNRQLNNFIHPPDASPWSQLELNYRIYVSLNDPYQSALNLIHNSQTC